MARKRPLRKSPPPPSPLLSPSPPSTQEKEPEKENDITEDEPNKEEMNTDNVEDDKEEEEEEDEEEDDDDNEVKKNPHVGKFKATVPSPLKSDSGSDSDNHFTIKPVVPKLTAPKPTKKTTEKAVPGGSGVELVLGLACEGLEMGGKKPKRTSDGRLKTADKKTEVKTDSLKTKVTTEEKGDEVEAYSALNEWLDMGDVPEGVRWVMRKRLREIEKGKLKALEERWRSLRKAELELFVQRMDLVSEQLKLVLDAATNSADL